MPVKPKTIGRIQSVAGTTTGAQADWVVPSGKIWRFISARGIVTTDANVATRVLSVRILDENGQLLYVKLGTGTLSENDSAVVSCAENVDTRNSSDPVYLQIPTMLHLREGMTLQLIIASPQAGDAFSDFYALIEEFDI